MGGACILVFSTLLLGYQSLVLAAVPPFPLEDIVKNATRALSSALNPDPIGFSSSTYLETISGIVNYFSAYQNANGSIIDPYEHRETFYSTPCYAFSAAVLYATGYNKTLLVSASLALTNSLEQLASGRCRNNSCHFFVMPSMLAYNLLRKHIKNETLLKKWKSLATSVDPNKTYAYHGNNWDTVALTGEFLRCKLGFCKDTSWITTTLQAQMAHFTANGQYMDKTGCDYLNPMPYDHFPRKYLAVMMEWKYNLSFSDDLAIYLERGAWVSLLMQSPWGELPTGGRSSQHQWNEAEQAVTYEIFADKSAQAGDTVSSRAFKRAAMLAHKSVRRWRRSSGDLFIVKNRFDPSLRHGYERYSYHSTYNLLTSSMLATAYLYCSDAVKEGPTPAEVGGFIFEIKEFHKIFANVAGMYVEIETLADPHYDSLGLTRIHLSGIDPLVMPSSGSSIDAGGLAIASPTFYNETAKKWQMMGQAGCPQKVNYSLSFISWQQGSLSFTIDWDLLNTGLMYSTLSSEYTVTPSDVSVMLFAFWRDKYLGFSFPVFLFDGQTNSTYKILEGKAGVAITWINSTQEFTVTVTPSLSELGLPCSCVRLPGEVVSRNGYLANVRCTVQFYDLSGPDDPASMAYKISPKAAKNKNAKKIVHLN
ncbi:uncharacterized protein LOC134177569 [Corticium candelabrum]|uniref:uncharacterized protein LOC134177569 n=1 Tax=Corticium candelabrum TaxID=121492 RepID=UPI002E26B159|nr:uncharacterized protein LOC134177569 [Corticium candelabrum]